jgi:hypothetical protein
MITSLTAYSFSTHTPEPKTPEKMIEEKKGIYAHDEEDSFPDSLNEQAIQGAWEEETKELELNSESHFVQ